MLQCFIHTFLTSALMSHRFQAQQDAVNLLAGAKTQANPESTVGARVLLECSTNITDVHLLHCTCWAAS